MNLKYTIRPIVRKQNGRRLLVKTDYQQFHKTCIFGSNLLSAFSSSHVVNVDVFFSSETLHTACT